MKKKTAISLLILLNVFVYCNCQALPFNFKVDSEIISSILAESNPEQKKQKIKYLITNNLIQKEDFTQISSDSTPFTYANGLEIDLFSYSVLELIYEIQTNFRVRQTPRPNNDVLDYLIDHSSSYLSNLINIYRYGEDWELSKSSFENSRSTDIYIYSHFDESACLFLKDTFNINIESLYNLIDLYVNQTRSLIDPELTFSTLIFQTESTREWEQFNRFGENMFNEWLKMDSYSKAFVSEAPLYAYIFKVFHSKHFNLEETSRFLNSTINNRHIRDEFASYLGTLIVYYKPNLIYKYLELFWSDISKDTFYSSFSETNPYSVIIKKLDVYIVGHKNCSTIQVDLFKDSI